jgi:hypothetical protein
MVTGPVSVITSSAARKLHDGCDRQVPVREAGWGWVQQLKLPPTPDHLLRGYCVEDDELSDLYFVPAYLSRRVSLLRDRSDASPFLCPLCGAAEWDLVEVQELADAPVEWRWACHPR